MIRKEQGSKQEDQYYEENDQNLIFMCVYIVYTKTGRDVAAAVYNGDERRFILSEFHDNEHFSNFESLLLQMNPQNTHSTLKLYIQLPSLNNEREKLIDIITLSEVEYDKYQRISVRVIATRMLSLM